METTVVKGLRMLETLARSDTPRNLTDLAAQCGISKSNAYRLLRTLEACGYVRRGADGRTYDASLRLWELGTRVYSRLDLSTVAIPHLQKLAAVTEETVHLSVPDGDEALYIYKVDSVHAIRTYVNVGDRSPLYCSATGKAMLAHMPEERVRHIARKLKRFTENTVRSLSKLQADLERIRQAGYSMTAGEWREGVLGFGRAIRSPAGDVLGAIGVAGPEERMSRFDLGRYFEAVLEAGDGIERDLGFGAAPDGPRVATRPKKRKSQRSDANAAIG